MKKIKDKGFTLVELLAVVVILALIALIIIPNITNMVDNARKNAFLGTAQGLVKAGKQYYSEKSLMDEFSEITFEFPTHISGLEFDGDIPKSGSMTIDNEGNISLAISDGVFCARKGVYDRSAAISELEKDCYIYEDKILNGANPVLRTGMIPVLIDADGTVTKTSTTSKWHDYANKKWANVVTVTEETRDEYQKADIGTIIEEEDILTYLVWIPRYKYKLWYTEAVDGNTSLDTSKVHSIDIVFENKNTTKSEGTSNGQYLTHPAFTFGEEELDGIWVGKFETGYKGATSSASARVSVGNVSKIIIKPNSYSWRYINISSSYQMTREMNTTKNIFGFGDDSDTHMMKNTEWGAVTYLAYSKYGKDSDVYINNNSNNLTGCGGNTAAESYVSTCSNMYGTKTDNVYNQSTTGNITGIFDMSGGALEYVMGYTTGATTQYDSSGFTEETFPEDKYIDIYTTTNASQYSNRILGDATGEMGPFNSSKGSWYDDFATFVYASGSWFGRGGHNRTSYSGLANFSGLTGAVNYYYSFRVVIA